MQHRESAWGRVDSYRVDLESQPGRIRVRWGELLVADTQSALQVLETNHDPVIYLPMKDIEEDLLESTSLETFCPFKGVASYWTLRDRDRQLENVLWSYLEPFEEVVGLRGYGAFYADRLEWEETD